jgi:hypothetical protein
MLFVRHSSAALCVAALLITGCTVNNYYSAAPPAEAGPAPMPQTLTNAVQSPGYENKEDLAKKYVALLFNMRKIMLVILTEFARQFPDKITEQKAREIYDRINFAKLDDLSYQYIMDTFSEDELKYAVRFYESQAGKPIITKMPSAIALAVTTVGALKRTATDEEIVKISDDSMRKVLSQGEYDTAMATFNGSQYGKSVFNKSMAMMSDPKLNRQMEEIFNFEDYKFCYDAQVKMVYRSHNCMAHDAQITQEEYDQKRYSQ